jgi:hypothetical protein
MDDYVREIIVVVIAIALYFATDRYFPVDEAHPISVKQKRFWSIMFLIISLVIGFPITASFNTTQKVKESQTMLQMYIDSAKLINDKLLTKLDRAERFQNLERLYDEHFSITNPLIKDWADEALAFMTESWSAGIMPIRRETAPRYIANVYPQARSSIIATNVGSTKTDFDSTLYRDANLMARDKQHIPVVRFYIYSSKQRIEMRGGKIAVDVGEFFKEVKELHERLGSLYSVVINVENMPVPSHRDLLIMDNKFVAETVISPVDGQPIRAHATIDSNHAKHDSIFVQYWKRMTTNLP